LNLIPRVCPPSASRSIATVSIVLMLCFVCVAQNSNSNSASTPSPTPDKDQLLLEEWKKNYQLLQERERNSVQKDNDKLRQQIENIRDQQSKQETWKWILLILVAIPFMVAIGTFLFLIYSFRRTCPRDSPSPTVNASHPQETLQQYHQQTMSELKLNSGLVLVVFLFGVAIIFAGLMLAVAGFISNGMVGTAAGVVVEMVGYLLYRQTDTVRNRVVDIQDQLYKLSLVDSMPSGEKGNARSKLFTAEIENTRRRENTEPSPP